MDLLWMSYWFKRNHITDFPHESTSRIWSCPVCPHDCREYLLTNILVSKKYLVRISGFDHSIQSLLILSLCLHPGTPSCLSYCQGNVLSAKGSDILLGILKSRILSLIASDRATLYLNAHVICNVDWVRVQIIKLPLPLLRCKCNIGQLKGHPLLLSLWC